jgi:CreA protein
MESVELYRHLLGLTTPWTVERVELDMANSMLTFMLGTRRASLSANAETIGCVTTAWKLIGATTRFVSRRFMTRRFLVSLAMSARPGPVAYPARSASRRTHRSFRWLAARPVRLCFPPSCPRDEANRTLVYVAISRKLIEGALVNSISTVPVMAWGGR